MTETRDQYPFYTAYLPYLLSQAAHKLGVTHHRELKKREIRESEWRVLAMLSGTPPKSVNQLASDTLIPQSTLSRRLVRMEEKNWLTRSAAPNDGRSYLFSLTESGARLAGELNAVARRAETSDTAGMSESELRQLRDLLSKLVPDFGR
ncbi:MAG: MarR family transcriptional regulator [Fimbriimonadaceae bacterium]|nr:MarR family transcriptional regulator [Alphaproteobacteria bacterium]